MKTIFSIIAISTLSLLLVASTALASTTIGTDINTGGSLTVTGPVVLLGTATPTTTFNFFNGNDPLFDNNHLERLLTNRGTGSLSYGDFNAGTSIYTTTNPTTTDPDYNTYSAQLIQNVASGNQLIRESNGLIVSSRFENTEPTSDNNSILRGILVSTQSTQPVSFNQGIDIEANTWANTPDIKGIYATASARGTSVADLATGSYVKVIATDTSAITTAYGNYVDTFKSAGATVGTFISYYTTDPSTMGATNNYSFWDDTRGVFRIKDDNSFNSVSQAIPALYNPQFTKYTPGASDYERVVLGQWNSNVAEIGPEAGGSGTLRQLRLLGKAVNIAPVVTASLPSCTEGSMKPVTDSNTNVWGATITGGGSNHVLAYCDGTNWTVMAK